MSFFLGGFLMDDNDDVTDEPKETRGLGMELVANLKQRLTNIPNEYSYFDHGRLGAWAGPRHWKFKPMSKFAGIYYLMTQYNSYSFFTYFYHSSIVMCFMLID